MQDVLFNGDWMKGSWLVLMGAAPHPVSPLALFELIPTGPLGALSEGTCSAVGRNARHYSTAAMTHRVPTMNPWG